MENANNIETGLRAELNRLRLTELGMVNSQSAHSTIGHPIQIIHCVQEPIVPFVPSNGPSSIAPIQSKNLVVNCNTNLTTLLSSSSD